MKKNTVDMTEGNIFKLLIAFTIPIIISGLLQMLYNAADMIVVGRFAGKEALAAVGSTSPAINLMLNAFISMSTASNVLVSRKFGAGDKKGVERAIHSTVALCLVSGVSIAFVTFAFSKPILALMKCPDDVINLSVLYMRIYCMGIPSILLYNFGSAIMRALGNAKRPTYYLAISGIVNVVLNLLFVIVFDMGVAGVAIATTASQTLSAALVIINLMGFEEETKLRIKRIRLCKSEVRDILYLGIPAGLQSTVFTFSNVIIQSSINSCGSAAMAGNSAAGSVEGFVYISVKAFFHSIITFVSQNMGAKKFDRIRKGYWMGLAASGGVGIVLSLAVAVLAPFLAGFYTDSKDAIQVAVERIVVIGGFQFLCGFMELGSGALRGLGVANRSMITCLVGVCGVRMIMNWMGAPYANPSDLKILYYSYPISWIITTTVLTLLFFSVCRQKERELCGEPALQG